MNSVCGKCSKPDWSVGVLNSIKIKEENHLFCGRCTIFFSEEFILSSHKRSSLNFIRDNFKILTTELILFKLRNHTKFSLLSNRIKSLI